MGAFGVTPAPPALCMAARPAPVPARTPWSAIPLTAYNKLIVSRAATALSATREPQYAFTRDIQTRVKPGQFADRQDDKVAHIAAATHWHDVLRLYAELGEETQRRPGLLVELLAALQRLLPPGAARSGTLPDPRDAAKLAAGMAALTDSLFAGIDRLAPVQLSAAVWALALLPDLDNMQRGGGGLMSSPSPSRSRTATALGAALLSRARRMEAEPLLHAAAGLALLGYVVPATTPTGTAVGGAGPRGGLVGVIASHTRRELRALGPKGLADAGYVAARMAAPGQLDARWMNELEAASLEQLAGLPPSALAYLAYALARHGQLPSPAWRAALLSALPPGSTRALAPDELPLLLHALARWAGSAGGPCPSRQLLSELQLASHASGALRSLPLPALAGLVAALARLGAPPEPRWLARLWPALEARLDGGGAYAVAGTNATAAAAATTTTAAGAASTGAALAPGLAALLPALAQLLSAGDDDISVPADTLGGLAGSLGLGLQGLPPRVLVAAWDALLQLGHEPDAVLLRQAVAAATAAPATAPTAELSAAVEFALAIADALSTAAIAAPTPVALVDGVCALVAEEAQRRADAGTANAVRIPTGTAAAAALSNSQPDGGFAALPDALQACAVVLNKASADGRHVSSQASADALAASWQHCTLAAAAAAPADPLLVLLGSVVDMPAAAATALQLDAEGARAALLGQLLSVGVLDRLQSPPAQPAAAGRRRAAGAAAAAGVLQGDGRPPLQLSVADYLELLGLAADGIGAAATPAALPAAAAAALAAALAPPSRSSAAAAAAAAASEVDAADAAALVQELTGTFAAPIPSLLRSRYRRWAEERGLELPAALAPRRGGRRAAVAAPVAAPLAVQSQPAKQTDWEAADATEEWGGADDEWEDDSPGWMAAEGPQQTQQQGSLGDWDSLVLGVTGSLAGGGLGGSRAA